MGFLTVNEIVECLTDDSFIGSSAWYDDFAQAPVVCGPLPWERRDGIREWTELDGHEAFAEAQIRLGVRSRRDFNTALRIALMRCHRDSLREWALSLDPWDGKKRAETLLRDMLGSTGSDLERIAWGTFMRGAFMRCLVPGIKFDYVPVLVGSQGCGKSTFCRLLAPREAWYLDGPSDLSNAKEAAEQMRGKMICELSELSGMSRHRTEAVKAAITRQTDTYRPPYAERTRDYPRRCVFVGTTNRVDFLDDRTGNRRFIPLVCGVGVPKMNVHEEAAARRYIGACWSEIAAEYASTGRLTLSLPAEVERELDEVRESYESADDRIGIIQEYLSTKRGQMVCTSMVAIEGLGVDREAFIGSRALQREITDILDNSCPGWVCRGKRRFDRYGVVKCWEYVE